MTSWPSSFRTEWWLTDTKCYTWLCEKKNENSYSRNGAEFLDRLWNELVQITVK
jgi:hypothetical protein